MDIDKIRGGREFPDVLTEALGQSRVLVAVIGESWLSRDADGRSRLDDPRDFVRRELVEAMRLKLTIIPVLLDAADVRPYVNVSGVFARALKMIDSKG